MRSFRSDNNAGLCPEALDALRRMSANGHEIGYGDDTETAAAVAAFRGIFGAGTEVFFVATGTAANGLAIAAMTEPWQQVVCHAMSHWNLDESTAPERLTGCRTTAIAAAASRITPDDLHRTLPQRRRDIHEPQPGVLTITNATEFGEVYAPQDIRALSDLAHELGYRMHVDGARFANAVARQGCPPAEFAAAAGVDAMSFGGTKNGLAAGEAVLFFDHGDGAAARYAHRFEHLRKSSGHLLSKHRFVSAPFTATLADGVWLAHAAHANAMATRLSDGLVALGCPLVAETTTNGVFVRFPDAPRTALKGAGYGWYRFGEGERACDRLMCSFDTTSNDVDGMLAVVSDNV